MMVRAGNNIPADGVKKILVRSSNWVGDTVMMLPSLVAVKKAFPDARITILANPSCRGPNHGHKQREGFFECVQRIGTDHSAAEE